MWSLGSLNSQDQFENGLDGMGELFYVSPRFDKE